MAKYVVNLERLQAIEVTVDVEEPTQALDAIREILKQDGVDWEQARVDQIVGCCLATGRGEYEVLAQKVSDI